MSSPGRKQQGAAASTLAEEKTSASASASASAATKSPSATKRRSSGSRSGSFSSSPGLHEEDFQTDVSEEDGDDRNYQGPRRKQLWRTLHMMLDNCKNSALKHKKLERSFDEFKKDKEQKKVRNIFSNLMDELNTHIEREFEVIEDDYKLAQKLNELDEQLELERQIAGKGDRKKRIEPDPSSVSRRAGDAVVRQRDAEMETLKAVYEAICKENKKLEREVEERDVEAKQIYEDLKNTVDNLDQVAETAESSKKTSSSR